MWGWSNSSGQLSSYASPHPVLQPSFLDIRRSTPNNAFTQGLTHCSATPESGLVKQAYASAYKAHYL